MRIAAIDVGTNTAKLLVADCTDGALQALCEEERFVRLGEGLEASGRVGRAALERLGEALRAYGEIAERHGAEQIIVAGTSASRAAENREALARLVRRTMGVDFEILSGKEEAELCFAGAVSAIAVEGHCAVVDIGGGSTEAIVGEGATTAAVRHRTSVEVGTVRLTERFFERQPPKEGAVQAAEDFILRLFRSVELPLSAEMPLIGASGTTTALAAVHGRSNGRTTPPKTLSADEVRHWCERLFALSFDEVMALHPEAMQGRADVFPAGVLILDALMQHFGLKTCRISRRELRHGLALRCAGAGP